MPRGTVLNFGTRLAQRRHLNVRSQSLSDFQLMSLRMKIAGTAKWNNMSKKIETFRCRFGTVAFPSHNSSTPSRSLKQEQRADGSG
jgi:hypothetical protein